MEFVEFDDLINVECLSGFVPKSTASWESTDRGSNASIRPSASECESLLFPLEITVESIFSCPVKSYRVKDEAQLVMDLAYLQCGWESRSFALQDQRFNPRQKLSLPGVSHAIIEQICLELSSTALEVLELEKNYALDSRQGAIRAAFGRGVREILRLHRTLVLKLGTVKSLPLFVKLTRRCSHGIRFIGRLCKESKSHQGGLNILLSLLSFSPYAHGDFEKKLLSYLLKTATTPYTIFIGNLMSGVIMEEHIDDFSLDELKNKQNMFMATAGVSGVLVNLHLSVMQCFHNGKILHSTVMKELIRENMARNAITLKSEMTILRTTNPNLKQLETTTQKSIKVNAVLVPFLDPQVVTKQELLQEAHDATYDLRASLGTKLEDFYKELRGRIKSQYDLENWKQRRSRLMLKRRGMQGDTILEEEELSGLDFTNAIVETTKKTEAAEAAEGANAKEEKLPTKLEQVKETSPTHNVANIVPVKKKSESEVTEKEEIAEKDIKKVDQEAKMEAIKTKEFADDSPLIDKGMLTTSKDPESEFLLMVLPLKTELQRLNATGLTVILTGMRFMEQMNLIKTLLLFQNRIFLESICVVANEPMEKQGWRISNVIDLVSKDCPNSHDLLKNVIFKTYRGINIALSLSYDTTWPMDLLVIPSTVLCLERASAFLLEIEVSKWKLHDLYKELLTSKKGKILTQFGIFPPSLYNCLCNGHMQC